MKKLVVAFLICLALPGMASSGDVDQIKWTNYFGVGGGFEVENIEQDHTAIQLSGAVSGRIFPHGHLMFQLGFYPFTDGGILIYKGSEYFTILTAGFAGRVGTASGGHGPSLYALLGGGWTIKDGLDNNGPYYSFGAGFETCLRPRLGVYFQAQYFRIDSDDGNFSFVALSSGVSFSPKL